MSKSVKQQKRYEDFKFRCRYDHFLRTRLLNASRDEIEEIARELGYKINGHEFLKKKKSKKRKKSKKTPISLSPRFLGFIPIILRSVSGFVSARH